jgi:hypothetical protein
MLMKKLLLIAFTVAFTGIFSHSLKARIVQNNGYKNERPVLDAGGQQMKDSGENPQPPHVPKPSVTPEVFVGYRHGVLLKKPQRPMGPQPAPHPTL